MSRYTGPLWRKSRALGISLLENEKEFSRGKKRATAPGQHGNSTRRRRISAYSVQNKEKQKVRFLYGLRERQLRNLFVRMKNKQGELAYNLLSTLEARLDNMVFRAGIGTRRFARQLVNHGHLLVNNKRVNIPSYELKIGDVVKFSQKIVSNDKFNHFLSQKSEIPNYITFDKKNMLITFVRSPLSDEVGHKKLNIPLLIEWYNKKV